MRECRRCKVTNYHIDGHPVSETYFWRSLEGLAGPTQIERLRTWGKLLIGGVLYEMTINDNTI